MELLVACSHDSFLQSVVRSHWLLLSLLYCVCSESKEHRAERQLWCNRSPLNLTCADVEGNVAVVTDRQTDIWRLIAPLDRALLIHVTQL